MTTRIQTSSRAVQAAKSVLGKGSKEYTGFDLKSISYEVPTSGSSLHDGEIRSVSKDSLAAYEKLINKDKINVEHLHGVLAAVDQQRATDINRGFSDNRLGNMAKVMGAVVHTYGNNQ